MDNSTLARAACSFSYSKPARHNPDTGANPRTKLYATVYDTLLKAKDTQKAAPKAWNVQGRDCGRAALCAVLWSGVDDSMPRTVAKMREHMEKSECWKDLGKWNGKESSLQPGDVLIRVKGVDGAKSNHVSVYVGHGTASETYSKLLKGTDADKGAPASDAAWVSAFLSGGNPPDKGYAPCIGNAKYASVDKTMHVFRCVNPQGSDKYTGIGKAQPVVSKPAVAQPIVSQPQGGGMLRVVDISSAQTGIDAGSLDCDAVIVKVTGGDYYTNADWQRQAESALAGGKLLGLYHYARDSHGGYSTPEIEARRFLDAIAPYIGRCVLALDWEHEADAYPISWAREWCEIVQRETGAIPLFYAGASDINRRDFSEVASYPLWMSSYLYRYYYVGWVDNPDNIWGLGAWSGMKMYQYSSTGRIDGWDDNIDLSIFYGTANDWNALIGGGRMRKETMVQLAIDVANDDSHGYSQASRWPWQGSDFDCSSLMYWSAHEAGYDVPLSGYTGTMLADFNNAGFTAYNYGDVELERGDILLAHNSNRQHTEMYIGDGQTVGAHSSETGGIYGQPGDQTGNEISIAPLWGDWDYVLRPPFEQTLGDFDMAEALIYCDDDHMGYLKDDVVYWNPTAGFCYLEHPDCIELIKQCSKGIAEIHSQSIAPWIERARLATNPQVAAETFGKRN